MIAATTFTEATGFESVAALEAYIAKTPHNSKWDHFLVAAKAAPSTFEAMPSGWFENRDESVACPHRSMFVCDGCHAEHPQAVNALGLTYWAHDFAELVQLLELDAELNAAREADRRGHLALVK